MSSMFIRKIYSRFDLLLAIQTVCNDRIWPLSCSPNVFTKNKTRIPNLHKFFSQSQWSLACWFVIIFPIKKETISLIKKSWKFEIRNSWKHVLSGSLSKKKIKRYLRYGWSMSSRTDDFNDKWGHSGLFTKSFRDRDFFYTQYIY